MGCMSPYMRHHYRTLNISYNSRKHPQVPYTLQKTLTCSPHCLSLLKNLILLIISEVRNGTSLITTRCNEKLEQDLEPYTKNLSPQKIIDVDHHYFIQNTYSTFIYTTLLSPLFFPDVHSSIAKARMEFLCFKSQI